MANSDHPDYDGIMSTHPDEDEEFWVHTSQTLGNTEGERIDKYAKIRVVKTRTVRSHTNQTER